ncbi:MAG: FkbM family methyltransferase, partial [Nitrospinaceae bacterium]
MRYWNLVRNLKNWDLYLAVKFGLTGRDPLRFVTRSGVRVEAPRRLLPTFKEVFMAEDYRAVRPLPARGPVIVDIGANAGFFSLYAASRHPRARVLAFEPVPVNFRLLQTNRDLNPEHRLEIFERAVSGKDGTANLTFDPGDAFTTSAHLIPGPGGQGGVIPVACISLPTLFAENGLNHCDFLKMDCEGAEF